MLMLTAVVSFLVLSFAAACRYIQTLQALAAADDMPGITCLIRNSYCYWHCHCFCELQK